IIIVSLLLLLVIISAVPSYLQGKWSWMKPPEITNLKQLRELQQTGLILPEWQTIQEGQITVGGHKWWVQIIRKEEEKPIFLLLLGQRNHTDQPEVEWMDIQGKERWKSDSYRQLKFNVDSASVVARFFRTYGTKQGFAAVVQWYATPNGGYTAPFQWFVADRLAQLHKSRVPWVAVSLKIPTQPGANIETVEELAKSLAKTVQKSLMEEIFSVSS
ncbi:MAG: cyanoexosortase B system-associated protein, partial [Oscillatoria sp. PMC 1076.18]|nr:cyanoexosortase B system-associated protein [Oscillatoria sp. PMC 1076.18]